MLLELLIEHNPANSCQGLYMRADLIDGLADSCASDYFSFEDNLLIVKIGRLGKNGKYNCAIAVRNWVCFAFFRLSSLVSRNLGPRMG